MEAEKGFWRGVLGFLLLALIFDVITFGICYLPWVEGIGLGYLLMGVNIWIFPILLIVFGVATKRRGIRLARG
jgi:hypothetical protein